MAENKTLRALIVDDESGDVELITTLLETLPGWRMETHASRDADECCAMLRNQPFDLIFLSYRLDAQSGFVFLKGVRSIDSEVPVVILTSRGDEHITAEIIRGGASDYLAKDDLSSLRVRRLVERTASRLSERREKKLAETLLRLSEQNYRTLVDNIAEIVIVHREGVVLFANQTVEAVLGYGEEEVLGRTVFEFIPSADDRARVAENMKRRSRGERVPDYEIGIVDKKGVVHTVMVRVTRTMFDDKPAFQVVLIDITKRKATEEQLLKAQKLESLGILAGGIAHDFNNILAGIVSGIAVAKMKTKEGSELYELLDTIEKASFKASELTQELLTFSQGGEPLRETCSVRELVEQTIRISSHLEHVSFNVELPGDLLNVVADKSQIGQVLSNLFINAAQAMPAGGAITIRGSNVMVGDAGSPASVEVSSVEETVPLGDGLYVKLEVGDTGMGIPTANREKIFDPYFTTKASGTGLGLATVYSILQRHNGYITLRSELGKGTTFFFYLPATLEAAARAHGQAAEPPAAERVLVMDDDETFLFTLEKYLSAIGYEVVCTPDGEAALRAYSEAKQKGRPFLAVLMDLAVPGGLGGREAVERLLSADGHAKAIAITGRADDPILNTYAQQGFVGALKKPFKPRALEALLKAVAEE